MNRSSLLAIVLAGLLFPSLAAAERAKVTKVDDHRYTCKWADGTQTFVTAGSKAEARERCIKTNTSGSLVDVVDEGPATERPRRSPRASEAAARAQGRSPARARAARARTAPGSSPMPSMTR